MTVFPRMPTLGKVILLCTYSTFTAFFVSASVGVPIPVTV